MGGSSADLRVEIMRGDTVETRHEILAAVVDTNGQTVIAAGGVDQIFPVRSTVKALQALPLLLSGAADSFSLSDAQLAVATASHNGEPLHTQVVGDWLSSLGLSEAQLQCGLAHPFRQAWSVVNADYLATKSRLKHNCSGKHAGFLNLAVHLGADLTTYLDRDGPVQQMVLQGLADRAGISSGELVIGGDGCGAPVVSLSARSLARAMATLLAGGSENRTILAAISAHPFLIAGTERFDTRITGALPGLGFTKVGAEGGHVAVLPDSGVAIAVKATSGDGRAAEAAMFRLLCSCGALNPADFPDLAQPQVTDSRGRVVGRTVVYD